MNTRQRFRAVMAFEPVDRLPAIESYWWWTQTLARWYDEGLPRELAGHAEIARYLGLDTHRIFWITPRGRIAVPEGRCRETGIVRDAAEYERLVRPIYDGPTFDPAQVDGFAAEQARGEVFVWLQVDGFFWYPRELLGVEPHFYAFYDQPDLLHRMNADLADYILRVVEEVCRVCTPDLVTFAEDMSYNHGPMLSKPCFDEFLAPYYRRVVPEMTRRGILPFVDSDGDITAMVPWLEEVGIVGATPLERRAGIDVNALRAAHPRFRMLGAFDKTVMHRGEAAIRTEFERLLPVMRAGGYIPSCDHQTPPEVSLADYRLYARIQREYCERAGG